MFSFFITLVISLKFITKYSKVGKAINEYKTVAQYLSFINPTIIVTTVKRLNRIKALFFLSFKNSAIKRKSK